MTYAERRTAALALAAAYDGWGRPPNPEGRAATLRVIEMPPEWGRKRFRCPDGTWRWGEGFVIVSRIAPNVPAFDEKQAAKERRQNREKF